MSRIIASEFMTLDGVVEGPDVFVAPALSAESDPIIEADVTETDHMVLGATTFAELFAYWPQQPDSVPVAAVTNRARKSIVSSSLTEASWGPDTRIEPDLLDAVRRWREEDIDVTVFGSISLVRQLVAAGELDELRLLVVPTVRGAGMRLFSDERADLSLLDSKTLENGVLRLVYEVARP